MSTVDLLTLGSCVDDRLPGVIALMRAHEAAALGRVQTSAAEAEAEVRAPAVDRDHSAVAVDGGWVIGLRLVSVERAERDVLLDCWVHPDLPLGRQAELMAALCDGAWPLARTAAAAAEPAPPPPAGDPWEASPDTWQFAAGAYRQDALWAQSLAGLGLRRVRTFQRMSVTHGRDVPTPAPPTGVTVASGEAVLPVAHRLHHDTFADHWGGEPERPFAEWLEWQQSFAGFDPALWSVAFLSGEPAGLCAASDARAEFGAAYIPLLGVTRAARGRGIARFLLRREFARSAARGYPETQLSVDSDSPTGADRLYRSVGMTPTLIMDAWLAPITMPADPPGSA